MPGADVGIDRGIRYSFQSQEMSQIQQILPSCEDKEMYRLKVLKM